MHIVYCPTLGYTLAPHDCGRRFRTEAAAIHFTQSLRKAGLSAWLESEGTP